MGFTFIKLTIDEVVSSAGGLTFRRLTSISLPPAVLENGVFDLTALGLPPGTYIITVTAFAENLRVSGKSNPMIYNVK